jgi:hypothetical protein
MTSRLNPDDQKQRRPFRPWMLLVVVLAITIGLGLLSRLISYLTL